MLKLFTESIVLMASAVLLIANFVFVGVFGETTLTTTSTNAAKETDAKLQNINGERLVTDIDFCFSSIFDKIISKSASLGARICF